MNPRLLGIAGPFEGTSFLLPARDVGIGRESSNDLWIADPALSRRHCLVASQAGRFVIRDLGSKNGTLVNGVPVEEQSLRHGDQIAIGDSILVFLLDQAEPPQPSSPVEFADTVELEDSQSLALRSEESLYWQPHKLLAQPQTVRLARDLNTLMRFATAIGAIRERDSLESQLLGLVFDVVPAERAAIVRFDAGGMIDSALAWDRNRGPGHPVRISRTVVERVRRERTGLVITNVEVNDGPEQIQTLTELRVCSVLCVPLTAASRVAGAIYLDTQNGNQRFDESHLEIMAALAGVASLALDNVRQWEQLRQENQDLRAQAGLEHNLVGGSERMREVFEFIRRVAPTDSTVLIEGESGTGKEMVARAIHRNSPRSNGPFVAINCAAIAETLLESELFGHEKGAFTGAVSQKKGKMEAADGGTLFLDEVSELAPGLQAKLLRVLQEHEFERVGGVRPLKLDARFVAATNRRLAEAVEKGMFRKDLYYRLNVVSVRMPALRERRHDILLLAEHFIGKASRKLKARAKPLSEEARACLLSYDWPGNVRELENALERALVLGSADAILPEDLPEALLESGPAVTSSTKYHGTVRELKKQLILDAFEQANGSYIEAANLLGMHPNSLLRLIRNLDLKSAVKAGGPPRAGSG